MATPITFTLQDGFYTSPDITGEDVRIHLNYLNNKSRVIIETSIDPTDGYAVLFDGNIIDTVFDQAIPIVEEQVVRIRCEVEPSTALTNGEVA